MIIKDWVSVVVASDVDSADDSSYHADHHIYRGDPLVCASKGS